MHFGHCYAAVLQRLIIYWLKSSCAALLLSRSVITNSARPPQRPGSRAVAALAVSPSEQAVSHLVTSFKWREAMGGNYYNWEKTNCNLLQQSCNLLLIGCRCSFCLHCFPPWVPLPGFVAQKMRLKSNVRSLLEWSKGIEGLLGMMAGELWLEFRNCIFQDSGPEAKTQEQQQQQQPMESQLPWKLDNINKNNKNRRLDRGGWERDAHVRLCICPEESFTRTIQCILMLLPYHSPPGYHLWEMSTQFIESSSGEQSGRHADWYPLNWKIPPIGRWTLDSVHHRK